MSDSTTKSAAATSGERDLSCFECGHDVVTDLALITMGTYSEVLCTNPWACWERKSHVPQ